MLVGSAVAISGCAAKNEVESGNSDKVTAQLRLMETSDIHANVMDFDYYKGRKDNTIGLARAAAVVATAKGEVANTVLVDNGDLIQGSPMGDYIAAEYKKGNKFDTHPVHKAMNEMDYVVGNIGNHEFNYGLDFLKRAIDNADFPYINANVLCKADCWDDKKEGDNLFTPYIIKEKTIVDSNGEEQTVKIGYIGFVPPQILVWDKQNLTGKVSVMGIRESAEKFVPEMKAKGADIIVAIPHSGIGSSENPTDTSKENATYALTLVDGIDAIMFGHSHSVFPSKTFSGDKYAGLGIDLEKGTINGVPAVMPGRWGDNMGQIDFQLELKDGNWSIVSGTAKARPIYTKNKDRKKIETADVTANLQEVSRIQKLVSEDHEGTLNYVNQPIGESTGDMFSFLSLVQDDPTVQIVSDAQLVYINEKIQAMTNTPENKALKALPVLSAAAPFKAGGRHSTVADADSYVQVAKGQLTYKNAADLYLYPNTVVALKINGVELKDWLECSANQFNQINPNSSEPQSLINWSGHRTYNFDVVDGVTYKIDVTQPSKFDGSCKVVNADASRIVDLTFEDNNGKVFTGNKLAEKEFIVVTNNYRAFSGKFAGTGADHVVLELPDMNRDALAAYITSESANGGKVDPSADNNWDFKAIDSAAKLDVRFQTQDTELASKFINDYQQRKMTKVGDRDEFGFANYQIDLKSNPAL
ncbi:bifunctional 2',3'-cyclic-nucleotide 2'-phosphodiesterase/3'-nucleotidase [Endozoicomonas sp. OPT23]|uniref:bifunctional 2',3'-cyclic-nucleotide 2'-phosphodiesterase/3'-nucleotidase n=1 Tax=Endozoicomonas sp. OPT23 TaxID=2072845 RepID=UPI00129BCE98|nr:bifunctional 2',3'-cyclic-nucleotide 2'-phosphodiesterase/3'-nucleotidase [Endozoicomonas sp. OPT23]MRI31474.1 bifunctional 2',3'-cyclic-nucleotide 2'-phosphodiesterase/3'-nucleotidase [Endozoicomonas sp. OPT23]